MRSVVRSAIVAVVALGSALSGAAWAQGDLVAEKEECEARGGEFVANPSGFFCQGVDGGGDYVIVCGYPDPAACESDPSLEPVADAATAEAVPSTELPATEPAPAQPGAPQYTG